MNSVSAGHIILTPTQPVGSKIKKAILKCFLTVKTYSHVFVVQIITFLVWDFLSAYILVPESCFNFISHSFQHLNLSTVILIVPREWSSCDIHFQKVVVLFFSPYTITQQKDAPITRLVLSVMGRRNAVGVLIPTCHMTVPALQ